MNVADVRSVAPGIIALQLDVGSVTQGLGANPDSFSGKKIDIQKLLEPSNFKISSSDDSDFRKPVSFETGKVHVKSKTTDVAFLDKNRRFNSDFVEWAQEHTIFLELPEGSEFKAGKTYTVDFAGSLDSEVNDLQSFKYQPETLLSEAIHVNQIGYDPDDPKVAFLSLWRGVDASGESAETPEYFDTEPNFWIVDAATGKRVEDSSIIRSAKLTSTADTDEDVRGGKQSYANTDVFSLDFSNFNTPGKYHLYVDGVGKSFEFEIGENTWERAFQVSMKGLYNQRSGTAIGGSYSNVEFERSFHPDDGVRVFATDATTTTVNGRKVNVDAVRLIDTDQGLSLNKPSFTKVFKSFVEPFDLDNNKSVSGDELAQHITTLDNAWGGYKDAGDWDRRIQHLWGTRQHLELLELFPEYFETVDLNLPQTNNSIKSISDLESTPESNGIPDLLDESLWSVDFFKRLQNSDGGVRGGIESAAYPNNGEASWQESQNIFAYAADPWSSYIYAGVAARMSRVLEPYDADLANEYRESAIRAIKWAENEFASSSEYDIQDIRDERNLAALELYLTTEESKYHRLFLDTTVFTKPEDAIDSATHKQQQAAFLYARAPERLTDETVRTNATDAIIRAGENSLAVQNGGSIQFNGYTKIRGTESGTAFKWTKSGNPWEPLGPGKLATPQVDSLLQAYALSEDKRFLNGAVLGSQYSAGANPLNTVFTTGLVEAGLAQKGPNNPFLVDSRTTNQEAPAGITVYGPLDPQFGFIQEQRGLYAEDTFPQPYKHPVYENYFDNYFNFEQSEFTIHQSIAPTAYTWGFLAASDFDPSQDRPIAIQEIDPETEDNTDTTGNPTDTDSGTDTGNSGDSGNTTDPVDSIPGNTPKLIAVNGTANADVLQGKSISERIRGFAGNDMLRGNAGEDELDGGGGNDSLYGGQDSDRVLGGDGNDYLNGQSASDTLLGGRGNDRVLGEWGNDRLDGQQGDDTLVGGEGNDRLLGGDGNDRLYGDNGDDALIGQGGNDTLNGGNGDDRLLGKDGADVIQGQAGNDRLDGGDGNDVLRGDAGMDRIDGGNGQDTLNGGGQNDVLLGGADSDRLFGGDGDDRLLAGTGNDNIQAGTGNDTLYGGDGDDTLNGGDGNDVIDGQAGSDLMFGGKGRDVFTIMRGDGRDWISDYVDGQDRIRLGSNLRFNQLSINQKGSSVEISASGDLLAVLKNASASSLTAGDFS